MVKSTGASEGTFPPKNKEWVIVTRPPQYVKIGVSGDTPKNAPVLSMNECAFAECTKKTDTLLPINC